MKQSERRSCMRKAFRLISLYIGSFDYLKEQTVNFCSDFHTTACVDAEGILHLTVKEKDVLPGDFFSLNEGNAGNGCVKSVSAIIGENGTGKTTLARLLCNLPVSDERKPEWKTVLIYEEGGEIKCYSTFHQVKVAFTPIIGARRSILIEPDSFAPFPYKLFYYSPHFTTEQFEVYTTGYHVDKSTGDEGDVVKDISTTRLMLHPEGNSGLLHSVGASQSSIFDIDEKIRLFEFIAEYKEKGKKVENKFKIPMPESITIGVHEEGFRFARQDIKGNAERPLIVNDAIQKHIAPRKLPPNKLNNPVDTYLQGMSTAFDEFSKVSSRHSLVINVFMAYAARYIQESGIFSAAFPQEAVSKGFFDGLKCFIDGGGWADEEKIKEFLMRCPPELPMGQNGNKSGSEVNPMVELIELLQEFCRAGDKQRGSSLPKVRITGNNVYCHLGEQELLEKACRLVRLHGVTRLISPYLKFDVVPPMSSGEMSFLTLFARLYHFIGNAETGKNIIVFLDEAETTLHPEWQRRLVAYCIRFFEVFLPGRNYQLIFASHSPMLLTDIPNGNVEIMILNEENGVVEVARKGGRKKSFAANIFELFRDSFVLTKGQMGEFAAVKVDAVLRNLKTGRKTSISNEDLKVAKLIDDPFLSQYVWKRLEQMINDNDMPEDEVGIITTED